MKQIVIVAHVIQTRTQDPPTLGWIEASVGCEPFAVQPTSDGLAVLVLQDPNAPIIDHPVVVVPGGVPVEQALGFGFGTFIGHAQIATGVAFVFKATPWPKTVLEAAPTQGNA